MDFLRNRRSSFIDLAFTKGLPRGLSLEDQQEIERQFKMANFSRKNEFILAYTRMAVAIGSQYRQMNGSNEDSVSVALVALCELPNKILSGGRKDDSEYSLDNYVAYNVRNACLSNSRRDHVMRISQTTMQRHKLPPLTQVELLADHKRRGYTDSDDDPIETLGITHVLNTLQAPPIFPDHLPEDITSKAATVGQLKVMQLIGEGYNNTEIASILLKSEGWVRKQLLQIKEILNDSLYALDGIPP